MAIKTATFNVFADISEENLLYNFHDTIEAIYAGKDIYSNVMSELSLAWEKGYKILLVNNEGIIDDIRKLTDRELRDTHNIYKLWRSGAFGNNVVWKKSDESV